MILFAITAGVVYFIIFAVAWYLGWRDLSPEHHLVILVIAVGVASLSALQDVLFGRKAPRDAAIDADSALLEKILALDSCTEAILIASLEALDSGEDPEARTVAEAMATLIVTAQGIEGVVDSASKPETLAAAVEAIDKAGRALEAYPSEESVLAALASAKATVESAVAGVPDGAANS